MDRPDRAPIAGSASDERAVDAGLAQNQSRIEPSRTLEITVLIRRRISESSLDPAGFINSIATRGRDHLDHEEFSSLCGADPNDIKRTTAFAREHGLSVVDSNAAARTVRMQGSAQAMERVFGLSLREQTDSWYGTYMDYVGEVSVPAELADIIVWVFGLRTKPVAWRSAKTGAADDSADRNQLLSPIDVARAYNFPKGLDGRGECIALIELPGGWDGNDVSEAMTDYGIKQPPQVELAFGKNQPGSVIFDDIEVTMDIEIVAALAPGANIAVYIAEANDPQSLYYALASAVHDKKRRPSVISMSLAGPEPLSHRPKGAPVLFDSWKAREIELMNELFTEAAAMGITICCASGDNGSQYPHGSQPFSSFPVTNFPASSPNVLSCGGTTLQMRDGQISAERVWNSQAEVLWIDVGGGNVMPAGGGASSGGVSPGMPLPDYQRSAGVPVATRIGMRDGELEPLQSFAGRGVPDVAANADINTGFRIRYAGKWIAGGGTSAAAPLWAALAALINQARGKRLGFLNADLYRMQIDEQKPVTNAIVEGSNGAYQARKGWDACTGLGSPNGAELLKAFLDLD
jgi:kumamolisin